MNCTCTAASLKGPRATQVCEICTRQKTIKQSVPKSKTTKARTASKTQIDPGRSEHSKRPTSESISKRTAKKVGGRIQKSTTQCTPKGDDRTRKRQVDASHFQIDSNQAGKHVDRRVHERTEASLPHPQEKDKNTTTEQRIQPKPEQ